MTVTRRKFLRAGAVSALFAGLSLAPSKLIFAQKKGRAAAPPQTDPAFGFGLADFEPHVGTEFMLAAGAGGRAAAARLELVTDLQREMRERGVQTHDGECFSLRFTAPAPKRAAARQATYRVEHARLGRFSLFLVPAPARDGFVAYEAVVNRLA